MSSDCRMLLHTGSHRRNGFPVDRVIASSSCKLSLVKWLTVGLLAALLAAACSGGDRSMREASQPGVVRSGSLSVFELMVGDCLADTSEASMRSEVDALDAVPCSDPHRLEVFAVVAVETGDDLYPGESVVTAQADAGCLGAFPGYTGVEYFAQSALYFAYIYPTLDSWSANDDRDIVCVVGSAQALNGSVKGAGDSLPLVESGS